MNAFVQNEVCSGRTAKDEVRVDDRGVGEERVMTGPKRNIRGGRRASPGSQEGQGVGCGQQYHLSAEPSHSSVTFVCLLLFARIHNSSSHVF